MPDVQVHRLARDGRGRRRRPAGLRERRRRSRALERLRVRLRARAGCPAAPRHPRHPAALGGGPAGPAPVLRVPISWLREYVPIELPVDEFATKLSVAAAEIEGIERIGVPEIDGNLDRFR